MRPLHLRGRVLTLAIDRIDEADFERAANLMKLLKRRDDAAMTSGVKA